MIILSVFQIFVSAIVIWHLDYRLLIILIILLESVLTCSTYSSHDIKDEILPEFVEF